MHAEHTDLTTRADIQRFVEAFYEGLLNDPQLAPIFLESAEVDIREHLPRIVDYWEKLLLGGQRYQRHTMNIHRALHAKRPLTAPDFELWLAFFTRTMDALYTGPVAERAKRIAKTIAANMQTSLHGQAPP